MPFSTFDSDESTLAEIGGRIKAIRLEQNQSQKDLALAAGVSTRTVERLESGQPTSLANFIRILRQLGLLDRLDLLVPAPLPSPIHRLQTEGKRRKRSS
ncbi:MAG: helix-turn-helix transcriptional regulator [Solirubrobacterales bacterium]